MPGRSFLVVILLLSSASVLFAQVIHPDIIEETQLHPIEISTPTPSPEFSLPFHKKDTVTLIGVGDIMMGSNYPDERPRLPLNDGADLMADVSNILNNADVTMGNLEGVLLDSGGIAKRCANPDACYVFRTPVRYASNLVAAGFDVMSVANNHAGDFGDKGRKSSTQTLDSAGIHYAGLLTAPYVIFIKDSIRYGFAAFAPNTGCVSIHDYAEARRIVHLLDSLSDVVIISFHGGAEGKAYQNVPRKNEIFYGEDRGNVYAFAHMIIDAGADVIFGQGPHVPRGIEVYKKRFIAYSLGNFCTYGGVNISGVSGLAPIAKITATRDGEFLFGELIAAYQTESGVHPDPEKRAIKNIRELTEKDFPENIVRIGDDGIITYLQTR